MRYGEKDSTSDSTSDGDHYRKNSDMTTREAILLSGIELTMGDRNKTYGDPLSNHKNIAGLWNAYLSTRSSFLGMAIDAEDVAMMMALVKVARVAQRREPADKLDTFIDMATYAAIAGEIRRSTAYEARVDAISVKGGFVER